MPPNYEAYRQLFPVAGEWAYLNHSAISPISDRVAEAMHRVISHGHREGWMGPHDVASGAEVRNQAAQLIGATPEEVCFVTNTSEGINIVANGLDWREGDNVISAETEFPANIYPWKHLARHGVELRLAPARENRVLVDDIARLMDARTRLVALSFVEFGTGYRNDLEAIGQLCRERGALLCVDGIQGVGAVPLDVRACQIDFLANGGHKWLMGVTGIGLFYCRRELIGQLKPARVGWCSVQDPDNYYCYDSALKEDATRWEIGCNNDIGRAALGAAIGTLLEVGIENVQTRIMALNDRLIDGLRAKGYRITTPIAHRGERSGIICFNHPTHPVADLAERLRQARVVVSQRGAVIRVSPHFYSNQEDIDRLLAALS